MTTLIKLLLFPLEAVAMLAAGGAMIAIVFIGIPLFIGAALIQAKKKK